MDEVTVRPEQSEEEAYYEEDDLYGYVNTHQIKFTVSVKPSYFNQIAYIANSENMTIEDCFVMLATLHLDK